MLCVCTVRRQAAAFSAAIGRDPSNSVYYSNRSAAYVKCVPASLLALRCGRVCGVCCHANLIQNTVDSSTEKLCAVCLWNLTRPVSLSLLSLLPSLQPEELQGRHR